MIAVVGGLLLYVVFLVWLHPLPDQDLAIALIRAKTPKTLRS